jgi:hypothetical protein
VATCSADKASLTTNLGSERDWAFQAEPNPNLNGRVLPMSERGHAAIAYFVRQISQKIDVIFASSPGCAAGHIATCRMRASRAGSYDYQRQQTRSETGMMNIIVVLTAAAVLALEIAWIMRKGGR